MASNADTDDYWAQAVRLYTGYPMPSRNALFDKLKSREGIPLMRVNLMEHLTRAVDKNDYAASSGWQASHGEDYRIAFYVHHGQKDLVRLYTADIVFIGTLADSEGKSHLSEGGTTREGGAFKGKYGDEWDDADLWRYVSAPKFVLDALVNDYKTTNFSYGGASVEDAGAVDLTSFDRTAASFDRAAKFFSDQFRTLSAWKDSLGSDKAAWKGESADVVRGLVETLHKNYEGYVEQMGGPEKKYGHVMLGGHEPTSAYSEMLFQAQWNLHWEARLLQQAWANWADTAEHDPHRALLEELDAVTAWVIANNVPYVTVNREDARPATWKDNDEDLIYTTTKKFNTEPGFTEEIPGLGLLDDINTWKKIGERAVERWNTYIDHYLVSVARQSLSTLGKVWAENAHDLEQPVETKSTRSLSATYEKEEAKAEKEKAEKAIGDADKKNKEAWESLNQNLSDVGASNKDLFDGLNNNQKLLNTGLSGLGDSLGNGLSGIGDNLTRSLNPDGLGGSLKDGPHLDGNGVGAGATVPLNGGLDDLVAGLGDTRPGGVPLDVGGSVPLNPGGIALNTGGSVPLNLPSSLPSLSSLSSLPPRSSTGGSVPLNPGGIRTNGPRLDADGNLVRTYPDGTKTEFRPGTGELVTTRPDGSTTTTKLNPGKVITNPDGSHLRLNADGTLTTEFSDGSKQVFDPSDGTVRTTRPDGTHTTTRLNDPIELPDRAGMPDLSHLPDLSGLSGLSHGGSSPLNTPFPVRDTFIGANHADHADHTDYADYDSTPFTGGRLGGTADGYGGVRSAVSEGAPPGGGTPLNPGFGAGAGAGAGGTNAERMRNVLNDPANLSVPRGPGTAGASLDTDALPFRGSGTQTTSSGMPMGGAPMGGMQGGQATESGERQRAHWVDEDEDVWGTEEGGAPAVIG
ncbi:AAWKG family protein [Streptomyces sp. NPDC048717]|uniref:AAWKG family protein n=1 Tax=Streptomyces sp. NPDC048717 TaxID=3154928 RepID=UPI003427AC88